MQANKNKTYKGETLEIPESEAGCYHVEFKRRMLPRKGQFEGSMRYHRQIYSIKDWRQIIDIVEGTEWPDGRVRRAGVGFLPLGYQEAQILHDPIIYLADKAKQEKELELEAARNAEIEADEAKAAKAESEPAKKKPTGRPKKV